MYGRIVGASGWWENQDDPRSEHLDALIEVHCPGCGRTHTHGWDLRDGLDTTTYRVAHCPSGSPLSESGYYIALDPSAIHALTPGVRPTRLRRSSKLLRRQQRPAAEVA